MMQWLPPSPLGRIATRLVPATAIVLLFVAGHSTTVFSQDAKPQRQIHDTTVSWHPLYDFDVEQKENVPFYLGGRFVGFGEDGFKTVIEKIGHLPSGTSVVWGCDCSKMLSGPGDATVAKKAFPEQWKQFQQVAQEREISLSGALWPHAAPDDEPPDLPTAEYIEPGAAVEKGDVILSWKSPKGKDMPTHKIWEAKKWPIYHLNGRESGRGPGGFLATLEALRDCEDGSRFRIEWRERDEPPGIRMFPMELREVVAAKRFHLAVECEKEWWPECANCPIHCRFEWRNFESKETPDEDVVYLVDGKLAGMGDTGFDAVLKQLRQLPPGASVTYPKYWLHPKAVHGKDRDRFEAKDLVPFDRRRKDLDEVIEQARLKVGRDRVLYWPKPDYDGTVDEKEEANWFLKSLLRFATIVCDGAKPAKADVVVSWKQTRGEKRRPDSVATYFCNRKEIGVGTSGFLAVLKRLESLADGATVRINPVCIRTHGPFSDPVMMKGQRHFETTGEEPFRGMVDLLGELADRKRLHVEVIPDEGKPYHYPGGK
jgi:hypothetical protein